MHESQTDESGVKKVGKLIETVSSLEGTKINFAGKKDMMLVFTAEGDEQTAAAVAKKVLTATPEFRTVYFQIDVR